MQTISLEAETRVPLTRGKLNAMRKEGWLPAIIYGESEKAKTKSKDANELLKIKEKGFLKAISGHQWSNVIIDLKWGKGNSNVVIKEIQRDAVSRALLHIDFQRISMTEKIEVMVPVHIAGESPGVKNSGGTLEHVTRELKILCLPKDIPTEISVDVTKLELGQGTHVKDLAEIPGVQILSDPRLLLVNVVAPKVEEEPAAALTAPTAAEPEVIKKGKKPEEGEAAAAVPGAPAAKAGEKTPAAPKTGSAPEAKK